MRVASSSYEMFNEEHGIRSHVITVLEIQNKETNKEGRIVLVDLVGSEKIQR